MRYLTFILLLFLVSCKEMGTPKKNQDENKLIPTGKVVEQARYYNNIIFLDLITEENDTLIFYTDTGGGKIVFPYAVEKLNLSIDSTNNNGNVSEKIDLAPSFSKYDIPPPAGSQYVYRTGESSKYYNAGMLGSIWFEGKIWAFDYINRKLSVLDNIHWDKLPKENVVELGFMKNDEGLHLTHFPRIPIVVDGDTIQTLLDTGAHMILSDEGQSYFNGEENVASSFIIASIFDKWVQNHPDWIVVKGADERMSADIIKVPKVSIGGHTVGPVWFAKRDDTNFTEYMSQWMDSPIEGAIGGSCFRYFNTMIIDYKRLFSCLQIISE